MSRTDSNAGSLPLAYMEVKQELLARLGSEWRPGMRVPSSAETARKIGAGQRNTHRAMAELASEGYLIARRGKGTFVNPDLHEMLEKNRAEGLLADREICVMVGSKFLDPIFEHMLQIAIEPLIDAGATVHRHVMMPGMSLSEMPDIQADAAVILNPGARCLLDAPMSMPTVVISTTSEVRVHASEGFDVVAADDHQGAFLAGQAMRRAGCQRPCFIGCTRSGYDVASAARLASFEAGFGRSIAKKHQLHAKAYATGSGGFAAGEFLKCAPRPDGVFAASDELAEGFVIGTSAVGLTPGKDYQLIGYDGQQRFDSKADHPELTSVFVPLEEMGRRGADLLIKRMTQPDRPPQRVLLACELNEGRTCFIPEEKG